MTSSPPSSSAPPPPPPPPVLQIIDARCEGLQHTDRTREWSLLHIDDLNASLSSPLTPLDHRLNAAIGPESILTKGEVSALLPSHRLSFPSSLVSPQPSALHLLLHNTSSSSPLQLSFSLPDALPSYLTLPNWVPSPSPSPLQRFHSQLIASQVFTVSPSSLSIPPLSSSRITVSYSRQQAGEHSLPVVMELQGGRWLTLQLAGVTEEAETADVDTRHMQPVSREEYQQLVDATGIDVPITSCLSFSLLPVAVHFSLSHCPSQPLTLYNDTAAPVPVRLTKHSHAQHSGLFHLSSSSAVLQPGSRADLRIRFRPTQVKAYSLICLLRSGEEGGAQRTRLLLVKGEGVLPSQMPSIAFPAPLPALPASQSPSLLRHHQLARLSCDSLSFASLPLHSLSSRVFVLSSLSSAPLAFAFSCHGECGLSSVSPGMGRLEPGQELLIRVELRAGGDSLHVDAAIVCTLNVEDDSRRRKRDEQHSRQRQPAAEEQKQQTADEQQQEEDEEEIVLASSSGNFPVNHVHTLSRLTGAALRFAPHPPLAGRLERRPQEAKEEMRLNALGLTGRVEDDKKRRERGALRTRKEEEEDREERAAMKRMETTYGNLKTAARRRQQQRQDEEGEGEAGSQQRKSDVLCLRLTARLLPLDCLEEEERQRLRQQPVMPPVQEDEAAVVIPDDFRRAEEEALWRWRSQFYFPPGPASAAVSDGEQELQQTAAERETAVCQLLRQCVDGSVVREAFGQVLPPRTMTAEEKKRRSDSGAGWGRRETKEEREAAVLKADADWAEQERQREERRLVLEEQLLDSIRGIVVQQQQSRRTARSSV